MNEAAYIDIQFKGKGFSPKGLASKTGLPIESLIESGELGKIGRFKNKPTPFGIGLLKVEPNQNAFIEYSDMLLEKRHLLQGSNVEEIIFDIDATPQFLENFTISNDILTKISLLNARIQFHARKEDSDDFATLLTKLSSKISNSTISNKPRVREILRSIEKYNKA
jgi:hypothetical protein